MTHRQYSAWVAWMAAQWNEPDRTDHYLMQIAYQVACAAAGKRARRVKFGRFKLPFRRVGGDAPSGLSEEQQLALDKAVWDHRLSRVGPRPGQAEPVPKERQSRPAPPDPTVPSPSRPGQAASRRGPDPSQEDWWRVVGDGQVPDDPDDLRDSDDSDEVDEG